MENRTHQFAMLVTFVVIYSLFQLTPTIAGYLAQGEDKIFLGFESADDYYTYAAYVKESRNDIFIANKNTPEPQLGRYFLPLFFIMGQFLNFGLSIQAVFLLFRFLEVVFLLSCIWVFLGLIFSGFRERFFSLAFISLAGGLGWLVVALSNFIPVLARIKSSDITYYLGYSLVGNLYVIHRYWALGIALLGFISILKFFASGEKKYLAACGMCALVIFFIHPVTAIFFISTITLFHAIMLVRERSLLPRAVFSITTIGTFMIPALIYSYWASQDWLIAAHQKIYFFTSRVEPLAFFLIGFGLVLVLGLVGMWKSRGKNPAYMLLVSWAVASFALTRIGFGAEYLIFFYLIMAIFSAKWLTSTTILKGALFVLVSACILSAPFVLIERASSTVSNPLSFITQDESGAIDFLSTQKAGTVLSDKRTGEILTFTTDHKVFISHAYLTSNLSGKKIDYQNFLDGNNSLFERYHIDYIWVEKSNRPESLNEISGISMIYSNPEFEVYSLDTN